MALIPLKEYAAKVGLAPSTIRVRIMRGVTTGVKIGRDWFIDEDEEVIDRRFTSNGKYSGWREKHKKAEKTAE